jgi:N utilization substance protein A
VGEELEVEVTPARLWAHRLAIRQAGPHAAHPARGEAALIFTEFKDRVGDIISGTVRRFDRSDVILDLGKYEALLPNRERVPTEEYQIGERIRCYVKAVEKARTGRKSFCPAPIRASSSSCSSWKFRKSTTARLRSKASPANRVSARSWPFIRATPKVDPVGACVGMRGQRVKNIVRELNNEKVDIIPWDANIKVFLTKALAPAQLKSLKWTKPTPRENSGERRPAFAGHRQARPERAADGQADRLAGGH